MKTISQHSRRLQAANGPLDGSTGRRGQRKSPLSGYSRVIGSLFVLSQCVPYKACSPAWRFCTILIGLFNILHYHFQERMNGQRETCESLRDERVTVSLNKPLPWNGSDLEMSLFCCSLEILRTSTISQNWLARQVLKRIPLSIKTFTPDPALFYNNTHDSPKRKTL